MVRNILGLVIVLGFSLSKATYMGFDLQAEVEAIRGIGAQNPERHYLSQEVTGEARRTLIAALLHNDERSFAKRTFQGREFSVTHKMLPVSSRVLEPHLDSVRLFYCSAPRDEPGRDPFWSVYFMEGRYDGDHDAFMQDVDGNLYTVNDDGSMEPVSDMPRWTNGYYFALRYQESRAMRSSVPGYRGR